MPSPALLYPPRRQYKVTPPEPVETWYDYFDQHRTLPMAPQIYDWTCSICATTWLLQATGLEPDASREGVAYELGYPTCVNPSVGLANSQCIVNVLEAHGVDSVIEWVDFDRAYELAASTAGILNSTRWYHFVGVRGVDALGRIWVANSASGYQGITETIDRSQWNRWVGSWMFIWMVR